MAEKKFGNRTFKVDQPLATHVIVLQGRLLKLVGPASDKLAVLFLGASGKPNPDKNAAGLAIIGFLTDIFGRAEPEVVAQLLADVVAMAQVKGANGKYEQAEIDTEFSSDPGSLYPVVGWILMEVLGPFLPGLVGIGSPRTAAAA